jgi:chromosome segregation ATPase
MGLIDFLKSLFKKEEKSYKEICKDRSNLKQEIKETLRGLNFSEAEVDEVLSIVDSSEKEIELLKYKLTSLCSQFENPMEEVNKIREQISQETKNMEVNLKSKVQEIKARKAFND